MLPAPYWSDEHVRVFHGDCLDLLPHVGEVDHCLTDPPYQSVSRADSLPGAYGKLKDGRERVRDLGYDPPTDEEIAAYAAAIAPLPKRWCLVFCGAEEIGKWIAGLTAEHLRHVRVGAWCRSNPAPQFSGDRPATGFEACEIAHRAGCKLTWNGGGHSAVWTYPQINGALRREANEHATPKPIDLMRRIVCDFTDPGETILDPFAGSGTTGVAARLEGRRAILIEREERHCEIVARRLERYPSETAAGQTALFGGG